MKWNENVRQESLHGNVRWNEIFVVFFLSRIDGMKSSQTKDI